MLALIRDARLALRSLAKSPGFTLVAALSLALGIGANAAIFTIFDQVLLRLLPVKDPRSLVMIATRGPHVGSNRGSNAISYPMYKDYRDRNEVFEGILCRRGEVVNLGYGPSTERTEAELVSGNYFQVLGVPAAAGRVFSSQDETAPGANPVVVLSHDFWKNRFAGDPSIVGQTVRINNFPMTIVGVAAEGFHGISLGYQPNVHIPVTMKKPVTPSWDDLEDRRSRWLQVFARLKPGITPEQAEASIRTSHKQIIQAEVQEAYFRNVPAFSREQFLRSYAVVLPGGQGFSGMRRALEKPMKILMALVALVLLIACANVSNLLVARAAAREREISIRLALGAARRKIVQQLLVESLLLAFLGAAAGLGLSYWTARAIMLLAPDEQSRVAISPNVDARILMFSLAAATLSALLFGLLPALQISRTDLSSSLKEQSGSVAGGGGRLRKALVIVQVALSFLLITGSSLFIQSLRNLRAVDPGFKATNLIRFKLDPTLSGYDVERTKQFYRQLQQRLEVMPGIESVGLAVVPVMEGDEWDSTVTVEGYRAKEGEDMNPHFNAVTPGYFRTLSIPLIAGRDFDDQTGIPTRKAAIVNETFARRYFGDRNPIGYHFGFGAGPKVKLDIQIVGVSKDTKYEDLRSEKPRQVTVCYQQQDWASEMTAYVRTSLPSSQVFRTIRHEMRNMDPNIPLFDMNTMEDQLDRSLAVAKLVTFLSGSFGLLATVLALIGLYGVTAYGVARRSREIGIRMALGAQSFKVLRMVLKEVLLLVGAGIALGLPTTWWLTRLVASQLYGVEPRDALSLVGTVTSLLAVALLAGAIPARRASRIDPVEVLRYE